MHRDAIFIAVVGDTPQTAFLQFVYKSPVLGSVANRYIGVHFILTVIIVVVSLALTGFLFWQHHRLQSVRANLINS